MKRKRKIKSLRTKSVKIKNHRWQNDGGMHTCLPEEKWFDSRSKEVGRQAVGWMDRGQRCAGEINSICSPLRERERERRRERERERRFQRYRVGPETWQHAQCPEEKTLSLCSYWFIHPPHETGDKAVAVEGSKGRVPGLHTHTHTPRHFISITNSSKYISEIRANVNDRNHLWEKRIWRVGQPLTWRRWGLWPMTQPATRRRSKHFGFTFVEPSWRPSLFTVHGLSHC